MEDPITIKAKKISAMKNYKRKQFLYKLILNSLAVFTCGLISSHPFYFLLPSISAFVKHFFISLPRTWTFLFSPKCLFIVVNVIVVFLVGESKLWGSKTTTSSNSSAANQIYDEYVEIRRKQLKRILPYLPTTADIVLTEQPKELVCKTPLSEQSENLIKNEIKKENIVKEVHKEKEEELPTEELNRRIEDFIARVNRQRRLESLSLVCCNA